MSVIITREDAETPSAELSDDSGFNDKEQREELRRNSEEEEKEDSKV